MKKIIILVSIYNDWKSAFKLLENIDSQIDGWDAEVSVVIINDASEDDSIEVINLYAKNDKRIKVFTKFIFGAWTFSPLIVAPDLS